MIRTVCEGICRMVELAQTHTVRLRQATGNGDAGGEIDSNRKISIHIRLNVCVSQSTIDFEH